MSADSSYVKHVLEQFGPNSGYIRNLYEEFLLDPGLVPQAWADFFSALERGDSAQALNGHAAMHALINGEPAKTDGVRPAASAASAEGLGAEFLLRVSAFVDAMRRSGHLRAKTNPLTQGFPERAQPEGLHAELLFSSEELGRSVPSFNVAPSSTLVLRDLIAKLEETYCGSVGVEYSHLGNSAEREWIRERVENQQWFKVEPDPGARQMFLERLIEAETLETELHKKYIGMHRFSLQGAESLIPMLAALREKATTLSIDKILLGMSHRGRINVLTHFAGKPLRNILSEFEDQSLAAAVGSGDVKYHLGYSSVYRGKNGKQVEVSLAPNPSHLEFVNPVIGGMARAKQDTEYAGARTAVLPVLLHGDAAFAGQGVVYEAFNFARLNGYTCGGTVHIIVNNQIGFTTTPDEGRSTTYCTDPFKGFEVPIVHVNVEDVEKCCCAIELALLYRQTFGRDVIVDLIGYRKYGHNEGDDPSFTQPLMYAEISAKQSVAVLYGEKLVNLGLISKEQTKELGAGYRDKFQAEYAAREVAVHGEACAMHGRLRVQTSETGVPVERLRQIADTLVKYPDSFVVHAKLFKILEKRVEALDVGEGIDWGFAETLAFGSLVQDGHLVRLSGQDCGRGTFSHRHLALDNYETQKTYLPFSQLEAQGAKGRFEVYNSSLSEAAVVGFEFGYSSAHPEALVLWEAQFGDFGNGAQVFIDQFISSSEAKWDMLSGIVMLLPHGYEGKGPEHSSSRLERYLQLCAEGNMVVCHPTTSSQYFHLLRRQGLTAIKRPLIVMTPKSLLRSPAVSCTVGHLTSGQFQTVLENDLSLDGKPEHVVMCSGKIYYDILAGIEKLNKPSVKLIRLEQLYPFPQYELKKALKNMDARQYLWVQEEPQNMGAWTYIEPYIRHKIGVEPVYIGRPVSASTATGSGKRHQVEQARIVQEVLDLVS